jgi:hypothetical protein
MERFTRLEQEQNRFLNHKDTYKDSISGCTIREIFSISDFVKYNMKSIHFPILIQHGSLDKVCSFEGTHSSHK